MTHVLDRLLCFLMGYSKPATNFPTANQVKYTTEQMLITHFCHQLSGLFLHISRTPYFMRHENKKHFFFHLSESLVLQSMRSHRVGHDWATDLNWTKWELSVRCIYQLKVLGRGVVLWWQMPAGGSFLNQQWTLVPAGPSCAHPVTGSVPGCAVCHELFCVRAVLASVEQCCFLAEQPPSSSVLESGSPACKR